MLIKHKQLKQEGRRPDNKAKAMTSHILSFKFSEKVSNNRHQVESPANPWFVHINSMSCTLLLNKCVSGVLRHSERARSAQLAALADII